ncbi:DUF6585 family protein [Streptomyces sp. NPDC051704]|uniref:DUF6585 family protein n=1 Tax=Streptomyces sp. NPDC051704 TaxID=3365671 RepID=UPI0037A3DE91
MADQAIPEELGQCERVFLPGRQGGPSTARRRKSVNVTVGVVTAGFAAVTMGMLLAGKPLPLALLPLVLGGAAFEWIRRHSLRTIDQEPYDEVELYENGLLGRAGGRQRHMLWGEVTEYWVQAYEPPTKVTADGPEPTRSPGTKAVFVRASDSDFEVMLSGLEAGGDLMSVAAERITAELLPGVLAQLRAGRTVEFGPLSLDAAGIHRGGRSVGWGELDAVVESPGSRIAVRDTTGKESLHTKASELPSPALFHALARQAQADHSAG